MESERQLNIQQYDREEILDQITALFQERSEWAGFRTKAELEGRFEDNGMVYTHRDGEIIAAVSYRHRETSHTTVYCTALAEDAWPEKEAWFRLIESIVSDSPHSRVISKVPADAEENRLWEEVGERIRIERGTGRNLHIWEVLGDVETGIEEW